MGGGQGGGRYLTQGCEGQRRKEKAVAPYRDSFHASFNVFNRVGGFGGGESKLSDRMEHKTFVLVNRTFPQSREAATDRLVVPGIWIDHEQAVAKPEEPHRQLVKRHLLH